MAPDPDRGPVPGSPHSVDRGLLHFVRALTPGEPRGDDALDAPVTAGSRLTARLAVDLLHAQMTSRHLDLAARDLRAAGAGFYTIGSSGHEGNAAVAAALRPTDPALLHYRSGAFFVHRAAQVPGHDPVRDVLLGVVAARDEPIAGGRHKVFGSRSLNIPPQTSTIASHLPKAVGMAFALERARRLRTPAGHPDDAIPDDALPDDAVIVCSFGDASAGHSTAIGAIHTACRTAYQGLPVPVLFVCEDNGLGISVPTPRGWIAAAFGDLPRMRYLAADGCDLASAYDAAAAAADHVRATRQPAFLHLRVVRLMGHAGSDVELGYRALSEIRADLDRDPLRHAARAVVDAGALTPDQVIERYEQIRAEVAATAARAATRPRLASASDVMWPLAPIDRDDARLSAVAEAHRQPDPAARARFWRDRLPEREPPAPLAAHITAALGDLLVKYPGALLFGEDVGRKGGVYGVTRGLADRAGMARVFDTVLDEQSILGLAIGAGQLGLLPIAEIQYLAYVHNAIDQLRGEAATLSFFSQARYRNPMIVRIASYAYQKGFGGHFHNDNAVAALREIPGVVIASPWRGDDAAGILRTLAAAARTSGAVSVLLEPIALYAARDLHAPGDGVLAARYDPAAEPVPIGAARVYPAGWRGGGDGDRDGDGTASACDDPDHLLLVSFANGAYMSLRVARRLEARGIRCRVVDLRWLAPLPVDDLVREAARTRKVLVVDETRRTGGVSEGVIAALIDRGYDGVVRRVAARDSFVPLGDAAAHVLVSEADVEAAALELCGHTRA